MQSQMNSDKEIQNLIDLISNTTEAYTTVLFTAPGPDEPLTIRAYQSLSRNIDETVKIGPGEGLVGWVHRNNEPVNVDQFESDTRRLLFYKTDESIKSFMATPLHSVHGVLAVDSKQRYIFTEKSHKILSQFAKTLEMTLERINQASDALTKASTMTFIGDLEELLGERIQDPDRMERVLELLKTFNGANACYLAAVFPGDPERFHLISADRENQGDVAGKSYEIGKGLAGWVLEKKKPLFLDRAGADSERSFLFHTDERIKTYQTFAGYPLIWGKRLRGALLFTGEQPLKLNADKSRGMEIAATRFAAAMELELLFRRIGELGKLDTQIGLPHRTFFIDRLNRMIKMSSLQGEKTTLLTITVENIDDVAIETGQDAAKEMMKSVSRRIFSLCGPDFEVGCLSHGVIGIAIPGSDMAFVNQRCGEITAKLRDRPLETGYGRVRGVIKDSMVQYPENGMTAEELILNATKRASEPEPAEHGE